MHRSECITSSHYVLVRGRLHFRLYVTSGFLLESGDKDSVIHPEKSEARAVPRATSQSSVLAARGACVRPLRLLPSPRLPSRPESRTAAQRARRQGCRSPRPAPHRGGSPGNAFREHSGSRLVLAFALTLSLQSQASKLIALLQSHAKSKVTAKLGNNLGFLWGSALPFICKTRTKKCRKFINTTHS